MGWLKEGWRWSSRRNFWEILKDIKKVINFDFLACHTLKALAPPGYGTAPKNKHFLKLAPFCYSVLIQLRALVHRGHLLNFFGKRFCEHRGRRADRGKKPNQKAINPVDVSCWDSTRRDPAHDSNPILPFCLFLSSTPFVGSFNLQGGTADGDTAAAMMATPPQRPQYLLEEKT